MRLLLVLFMLAIVDAKRKPQQGGKNTPQRAALKNEQQRNPYSIYSIPVAVDFIQLGKEGILDPTSGLKHPFDGLAFDRKYSPEELKMRQNASRSKNMKITRGEKKKLPAKEPEVSVREYNPNIEEGEVDKGKNGVVKNKMPMMFDFEMIQNLNVASPFIYRENIAKSEAIFKKNQQTGYNETMGRNNIAPPNVTEFFLRESFQLGSDPNMNYENWTTCDDFSKNARFHPREVAGVDWVPFYVWTPSSFPKGFDFSFSYPTKKKVEEYKTKYSKHLNKNIDWKRPVLLLNSWIEILLVAGDRKGLFFGIPNFDIPESIKDSSALIPSITMRMKIVGPYLGLMLCDDRIGLILAAAGEEPAVKDRETEAAKLGFRGIGQIVLKDDPEDEQELEKSQFDQLQEDDARVEDTGRRRHSPFFSDDP